MRPASLEAGMASAFTGAARPAARGDGPLFGDLQQAAAQGEVGTAGAGRRAVGPL